MNDLASGPSRAGTKKVGWSTTTDPRWREDERQRPLALTSNNKDRPGAKKRVTLSAHKIQATLRQAPITPSISYRLSSTVHSVQLYIIMHHHQSPHEPSLSIGTVLLRDVSSRRRPLMPRTTHGAGLDNTACELRESHIITMYPTYFVKQKYIVQQLDEFHTS